MIFIRHGGPRSGSKQETSREGDWRYQLLYPETWDDAPLRFNVGGEEYDGSEGYDRTLFSPDPGDFSSGMLFVAMLQINWEKKELS
jgi:hypothetical protein